MEGSISRKSLKAPPRRQISRFQAPTARAGQRLDEWFKNTSAVPVLQELTHGSGWMIALCPGLTLSIKDGVDKRAGAQIGGGLGFPR